MKLSEKQEKYPIGSLWRCTVDDSPEVFVRRVAGYSEDMILLGTVEGYPDPPAVGHLPDDPYSLFDEQMDTFTPLWLPEDVEEAVQGLLGLNQELQRF
jgi:hypothetical protein